ncbi:MAG: transposase family protein, partial [Chloroflexi bacterium]|nr:transposase family protein [Chloroflexota bacterium]
MSIVGPFTDAPQHQRHIVAIVDYASQYPECLLTLDICSVRLISWLGDLFSRCGNPDQLVTDNSPQFSSPKFATFLNLHGVKHICTAVGNPSGNSLVEVLNWVQKDGVQHFQNTAFQPPCFVLQPGPLWEGGIHELLKAFRAMPPKSGQKCPAEMFFGRPFRLDFPVPKEQPKLLVARPVSLRGHFAVGDLVSTRRPQAPQGHSLLGRPLHVVQLLGRYAYHLSDGQRWNARRLKRYLPSPLE